ncbi:MAG: putative glycolipid-binding domain-containing protein [Ilumatobacteraceae bacterium]|nr:putative glycolipid-binding domain-containing protein [Ilumatobacteraceae bacterium]
MSAVPNHVSHLPLEGMTAIWQGVANDHTETLTLHFENESWTINSQITGLDIQYVLRLTATWQLQQMLLFRDLDEPDLWLANDGRGKWGEVNGAQIRDIGGCTDLDVRGSSFSRVMAIRKLAIDVGSSSVIDSVVVDPETLGVTRSRLTYTRLAEQLWKVQRDDDHDDHEVEVDTFGLPLDIPGHFTRLN